LGNDGEKARNNKGLRTINKGKIIKIEEMANIFAPILEDKKTKTQIGSSPVVLNVSKKILAR
jgi:hypothetical protein